MAQDESSQAPRDAQSYEFRAEIQQLLHILVHSLYTEQEIFLRELISNASDALNRFQFEMLTRQADEIVDPEAELAIRVTTDEEGRTLTISDSGIGLTREEMIENLGTIARSGAATFLRALQEKPAAASEIIGQFGVGFYAVFMVADRVEVISRSFRPDAEPVRWISTGGNEYEIAPAEKESRGTDIIVHLKEEAAEFARPWRAENIIKKHSNFVAFPVYLNDKQANERTALWRQTPRTVTEEEYQGFYKQLTMDFEPPLLHVHLSAEVPNDLHAILFIPPKRERGILRMGQEEGLKLYSRKVLIQERTKELLPAYFRFVEGVVDSEDLPLNISRETVQSNRIMAQLKRALTDKLHKELERLAEEKPESYEQFWEQFGPFLKEGIATDFGARTELASLLRFHSSALEDEGVTSLKAAKERMAEGQEAIYYVLGEDLRSVRRSPHLDSFRARTMEVLFLVDPIDSFMISNLREFDGTPIRNVDDPEMELPPLPDEEERQVEAAPEETFHALLERAKAVLGERVTDVRESKRLTDSPVRLAVTDESFNPEMDRVRRMMREQQPYAVPKRALELNRSHPLIRNLATLAESSQASGEVSPLLDAGIEQLYESALLLEGLHPNPAEMVPRIQQLLEWAAAPRS
ncbi:MAG: molecular chaperone HtpG [Ardenticatenales bacterium]|nr:molecular chaperone HtpG [Ardenticatenales bacterium]